MTNTNLESYFRLFQKNIIGDNHIIESDYGKKPLIYADWMASGRLYAPIEQIMINSIGPMIANTHSFSSETGKFTTLAYHRARQIIKEHVNAGNEDVLVTTGTGMTAALSKLQRLMGLKGAGLCREDIAPDQRPIVFISEVEHHSHHVPWMETIADVVFIPIDGNDIISFQHLEEQLYLYKDRVIKIGAFTACSNVTGQLTAYHDIARLMHYHNGYCFVDFAASAPYVTMNMHPTDPEERLDAIYFSPHKFLGGPGSSGILIFNKELYKASCPDNPGGGNVKWTSPDGSFAYYDALETREDGGTPGFLQVIRAALAMQLKGKMNVQYIRERETELLRLCFKSLKSIPGLFILGDINLPRIGCVSFGIKGIHYNLIVRLLNDRFGIQVRGGWSCASTYAHRLFSIDPTKSRKILNGIDQKNLSDKPGWVRLSIHPTLSGEKLAYICDAIAQIQTNYKVWQKDYKYCPETNEFDAVNAKKDVEIDIYKIFDSL